MRKFTAILSSLLLFWNASYGLIYEVQHFKELKNYVDSESLVLLDIDDTLLIPCQMLGNDMWFQYRLKQLKTVGLSVEEAKEKALAEWEAIRHLTKVQLVEPDTAEVVAQLQKEKVTIIGLTTQGLALATRTFLQLLDLKIDLRKTAISQEDYYFINQIGNLYRKGILFTSGTAKGVALFKLLDHFRNRPNKVVFINDKLTHLQDVESEVEQRGIEFIGLRYAFSDQEKAKFDPSITEIQFAPFRSIMSDEEAKAVK